MADEIVQIQLHAYQILTSLGAMSTLELVVTFSRPLHYVLTTPSDAQRACVRLKVPTKTHIETWRRKTKLVCVASFMGSPDLQLGGTVEGMSGRCDLQWGGGGGGEGLGLEAWVPPNKTAFAVTSENFDELIAARFDPSLSKCCIHRPITFRLEHVEVVVMLPRSYLV